MRKRIFWITLLTALWFGCAWAQETVPILSSSVDSAGCTTVQVASSSDYYYVLYATHDTDQDVAEWPVSITLGQDGITLLTDSLAAFPIEQYYVVQYPRDAPADLDLDGIDDVEEMSDPGRLSPLNPAPEINPRDGMVSIPDRETFHALSYRSINVPPDMHLKNLEFVKFIIDVQTDNPKVYFINTLRHQSHPGFAQVIGLDLNNYFDFLRGEIVYHPYLVGPNGQIGVYRFQFQPFDAFPFEDVQMAHELLAANMPLLRNNFAYYPMPDRALPRYEQERDLYDASRILILLEEDIYANSTFMALNTGSSYGLLRLMELNERPNWRDIVIYEALPNEMSRVGGIITTVPQTPLSHINLRAIQDDIPNASARGFLQDDSVTPLIGKHVYFRVNANDFEMREASPEEVEAFYEHQRPTETWIPVRDLSVQEIIPLDVIRFEQSSSFGVKTANLATMRTFDFPEGTIPDGFGIPFYFYDEFMKYNGLYQQAQAMLDDPNFQQDYNIQEETLAEFRKDIERGAMPDWMLEALSEMQTSFPVGTSLRCRSSTNNEDLPGFSGAGLYDSRTHHPYEGHISHSIKQIYSSLWNFRAFDERQFYRIDHLAAAMGVLVHPNFTNEQANGVGVTIDPIYKTKDAYYLNTQVGEDLVTNPKAQSIPEEIILYTKVRSLLYTIVHPSNQVPDGQQVLSEVHLQQLFDYLKVIHNKFGQLYDALSDRHFAMEIEYKITSEGHLVIKQARPWISH